MSAMKTAKQLKITPTQFKNLAKLTMFVRDKARWFSFDINFFFSSGNDNNHFGQDACPCIQEYQCGTTACFLGYGIPAGIKAHKKEIWSDYCKRAFGINMVDCGHPSHAMYRLLFSESHRNNKDAAALRGAWLLMNGLPHGYLDCWETPVDFDPDWSAIEAIANS